MASPPLPTSRVTVRLTTDSPGTQAQARLAGPGAALSPAGAGPISAAAASALMYGGSTPEVDHRVAATLFRGAQPMAGDGAGPIVSTPLLAEPSGRPASSASAARRSAAPSPSPRPAATTSATAAGGGPATRGAAWRCGLCNYYTLAMDGCGRSLPLSLSAFGAPLPMRCPRCQLEHTSWVVDSPFDAFGRHVNLCRSAAGRAAAAVADAPHDEGPAEGMPTAGGGTAAVASSWGHTRDSSGSRRPRAKRMCYFCNRCGRRLLRVDAEGELVAMSTDADGAVLPITCPGCRETHNEWSLRPFFSHAG